MNKKRRICQNLDSTESLGGGKNVNDFSVMNRLNYLLVNTVISP